MIQNIIITNLRCNWLSLKSCSSKDKNSFFRFVNSPYNSFHVIFPRFSSILLVGHVVAHVTPSRALDEGRFAATAALLVPGRRVVVVSRRQRARTHPRVWRLLTEGGTVAVLGVAALTRHVGVDVLHHTRLLHDRVHGGLVAEDVHFQVVCGSRERDVRQVGLLHQLRGFLAADGGRGGVCEAEVVDRKFPLYSLRVLALVCAAGALVRSWNPDNDW